MFDRTVRCLNRNMNAVLEQWFKDIAHGRTPAVTIVCIEAMLFSVWAELQQWPDNWEHKHYFWPSPDNRCSCGMCVHGVELLPRSAYYAGVKDIHHCDACRTDLHEHGLRTLAQMNEEDPYPTNEAVGVLRMLVMGTPQG